MGNRVGTARFTGVISWLLATAALDGASLHGAVVLSEVMYHPLQGSQLEYVEIHNAGAQAVDIGGWQIRSGIAFTVPAGTSMPPGAYRVIAASEAALRALVPSLLDESVVGDFAGSLANEGERIELADAQGQLVDALTYDDDPPWDFLPDGFGASLERICYTTESGLPENWRAGRVPTSAGESGGSPGLPNGTTLCPPAAPARPRVRISEIMYHPVLEEWYEDLHEFVEVWNGEAADVPAEGWRIAGAVDYVFPAGAVFPAGQYVVVAKDRTRILQIASYALDPARTFGNYARTLDNGGEKVALLAPDGSGVDSVSYDDDFPWPIAADALGAGEMWLRPALLPLENHRHRGHSLERVSLDLPAGDVTNWAPSPLDAATPGRPNASARATPLPIVTAIAAAPETGGAPLIRAQDAVRIQALFAPASPTGAVRLEYFVEDVAITGEPVTSLEMRDDGLGADILPGDGAFSALLPSRPDNTIVRYRILADRGVGVEVISPRPTDPYEWHSYFVSPVISSKNRVYQVFISPASWGQMWRNIEGGRVSGCTVQAGWEAKVPAVFVYEGKVYDARVRYHGSRYNRWNGPDITGWTRPAPNYGPLRALSWRVALPRYSQLDGAGVLILNKLTQGCPGYTAGVGFELFAQAGLPAPLTRYARLHINGGYYHYTMQYEHPDEDMMRRYHADLAARFPEYPDESIGDLFKSGGCNCDEGPFGWGDERVLNAYCGFTKEARYAGTYERRTWEWSTSPDVMDLIEELNAARATLPDTNALAAFFEERFDMELLLNYMAVMNWAVPFDDMFQNHFLYRRSSDGKWVMAPWDLDLNFGGWLGASASLYMGERDDPDNRSAWWNYLKDAFLKTYRPEYEARLLELSSTILHPDNVSALVDAVLLQASPTEAAQAPAGVACSFTGAAAAFKSFAVQRQQVVNDELSSTLVDAGPDQTVLAGTLVQFDARKSRPDPGPGVTYQWDNGMTGDHPSTVFAEPGTYIVTLTLTVTGIQFRDSVRITVIPAPTEAFAESGGRVTFEAEAYYRNEPHGETEVGWVEASTRGGYSGSAYMEARFTAYKRYPSNYASTAPELRYPILFETTGTYRVWVRAVSLSQDADSCHVGLDGAERDESFAQRFVIDPSAFTWSGDTRGQGPQLVTVSTSGLHFVSVWVRESGQIVDKILLTTDPGYAPSGAGPDSSPEVPLGTSNPPFVRGDSNGDHIVDVSDALTVLFHLFLGAGSLTCPDHGDANDDGALQVTDAVNVLSYLFQGGPAPLPPFPAQGWDPTADAEDCGAPRSEG